MTIGTVIKEGCAFAVGFLLSCGPSQVFGLIKGAIDLVKLCKIQSKISQYGKAVKENTAKGALAEKQVRDLTQAIDKLGKWESRLDEKKQDLKADAVALIPFVGAILAWRLYPSTSTPKYLSTPGLEYSFVHALRDHSKELGRMIFYPLAGQALDPAKRKAEGQEIRIPVADTSGSRSLDARFHQHDSAKPRETVVIFHGNGMTCDDMDMWGEYYFNEGYDVLLPTMGGYPGSDATKTSEESSYRDVEAIKLFLQKQGVKQAGYHGLSIGGSLAFAAGAGATKADKLETKFIIADQTFTTGVKVADNLVHNVGLAGLGAIARGASRASVPEGRKVVLGEGVSVQTDGLDNEKKAARLKELGIPLLVIKSNRDFLMGIEKREDGSFTSNFADELLFARYGADIDKVKEAQTVELHGGHCACFAHDRQESKVADFIQNAMPLASKIQKI